VIDADRCTIDVDLSDEELVRRRAAWTAPPPKVTRGVLAKYVRCVAPASQGCVTDEG
jgi:dihydroxy-acid dehydratase